MLLGQPDERSIKGNWGALASAKEFTLETEGHISHPGFLPERLSGRDIQSLAGGGLLCLGGGWGWGGGGEVQFLSRMWVQGS